MDNSYHVGWDQHKKFSHVVIMDPCGRKESEYRVPHTTKEAIQQFVKNFLPSSSIVALEAGRSWYWLVDLLENELGEENVKMAHPLKVKLIAEARIKTDKIDANILANLERTNFLPLAYKATCEVRQARELLRTRQMLVKLRSGIKNRIHSLLEKLFIRTPNVIFW